MPSFLWTAGFIVVGLQFAAACNYVYGQPVDTCSYYLDTQPYKFECLNESHYRWTTFNTSDCSNEPISSFISKCTLSNMCDCSSEANKTQCQIGYITFSASFNNEHYSIETSYPFVYNHCFEGDDNTSLAWRCDGDLVTGLHSDYYYSRNCQESTRYERVTGWNCSASVAPSSTADAFCHSCILCASCPAQWNDCTLGEYCYCSAERDDCHTAITYWTDYVRGEPKYYQEYRIVDVCHINDDPDAFLFHYKASKFICDETTGIQWLLYSDDDCQHEIQVETKVTCEDGESDQQDELESQPHRISRSMLAVFICCALCVFLSLAAWCRICVRYMRRRAAQTQQITEMTLIEEAEETSGACTMATRQTQTGEAHRDDV